MIRLNGLDIDFMLSTLSLSEDQRELLNSLVSKDEKLIPDEVADELRDLCGDRLVTHGFDINYDPTEEGTKLEDLVDKLFTD